MDEPLSNLDSGLRAELRAEISGLVRELGVTTDLRHARPGRGAHHGRPGRHHAQGRAAGRRHPDPGVRPPGHALRGRVPRQPADEPARGRRSTCTSTATSRCTWATRRSTCPGTTCALAPGRALPRRAHRRRRAGRGAHPGGPATPRATCCTAGSATSSTTGTSRSRSSTSARPRCRRRGRYAAAELPPEHGLRRFVNRITGRGGGTDDRELVAAGANGRGRAAPRESVLSDPGRHHRRPAELAVRLAPYPAVNAWSPADGGRTHGGTALLRRAGPADRRRVAVKIHVKSLELPGINWKVY